MRVPPFSKATPVMSQSGNLGSTISRPLRASNTRTIVRASALTASESQRPSSENEYEVTSQSAANTGARAFVARS